MRIFVNQHSKDKSRTELGNEDEKSEQQIRTTCTFSRSCSLCIHLRSPTNNSAIGLQHPSSAHKTTLSSFLSLSDASSIRQRTGLSTLTLLWILTAISAKAWITSARDFARKRSE